MAAQSFDIAEYDTRQRWRTRPPEDFPSNWACEWGFDEYGLWQTFEVVGAEGQSVQHKMRYIPPGEFLMGAPEDEAQRQKRETQHLVTLTQGFWLGETTVTQALWQLLMGENPSYFKAEAGEQLPVERVSWHDCMAFCSKLSELAKVEFTLPTEAQWEYACRAGTTTPFSTGEQLGFEQGNYDVKYPYQGKEPINLKSEQKWREKTVEVHQFKPNPWGLKQMHGNVWELCRDDFQHEMTSEHKTDPLASGDKAADAVLRGGSWYNFGWNCRSAYRHGSSRDERDYRIGLRLSQVLNKKESVQA